MPIAKLWIIFYSTSIANGYARHWIQRYKIRAISKILFKGKRTYQKIEIVFLSKHIFLLRHQDVKIRLFHCCIFWKGCFLTQQTKPALCRSIRLKRIIRTPFLFRVRIIHYWRKRRDSSDEPFGGKCSETKRYVISSSRSCSKWRQRPKEHKKKAWLPLSNLFLCDPMPSRLWRKRRDSNPCTA